MTDHPIRAAFDRALDQALSGKGEARHGLGRSWEDQPICRITSLVGHGFPMGQALKKIEESVGMISRAEYVAAQREILGAMVYLAHVESRIAAFTPDNKIDDAKRTPQLDEAKTVDLSSRLNATRVKCGAAKVDGEDIWECDRCMKSWFIGEHFPKSCVGRDTRLRAPDERG